MSEKLEEIMDLLENEPELAKKIYEKLRDKFVTLEHFEILIEEMKALREESNKKFEMMEQRFEESKKLTQQGFDDHDKRFDDHDKRFDRIDRRLDDIQAGLGINFEGYNKNVLMNFLEAQKIPAKKMEWRAKIKDPERKIHEKSTEVEIDLFLKDPLIIVEVTSMERSIEKVRTFIKIIKWLEAKYNKNAESYYLLFDFDDEIRDEAYKILQDNSVRIISTQT